MLQEANKRFWEEVMNTIMEGVVVLDPRGVILAANQAMEEITGYRQQELIGKPCALIKSDACFDALTALRTLPEWLHPAEQVLPGQKRWQFGACVEKCFSVKRQRRSGVGGHRNLHRH